MKACTSLKVALAVKLSELEIPNCANKKNLLPKRDALRKTIKITSITRKISVSFRQKKSHRASRARVDLAEIEQFIRKILMMFFSPHVRYQLRKPLNTYLFTDAQP